ncbi:3-carboxy-cis,cis-muconate cycloisomerase [Klugiella xanthotipulae]|uniref:3-carboxy-cis,cis-muconate cycloisomerase n=1 Tax=Klugiella xanthotipulae TaxID=244735 RepID=A0A543HTE6_9MICO|nr:lyase family protein [Klugiella xanthotipulae]TQM61560.1 3-carboxy-cis,cis-muconate cycloisomerase [Klugiella xanthotipulae]
MSANTIDDLGLVNPLWVNSPAALLSSDARILQFMLDVECAWMAVLVEGGRADPAWLPVVTEACRVEHYNLAEIAREAQGGGNPLIPLLGALRRRVGETSPGAAARLHVGATSQDILDTALLLVARDVLTELRADLNGLADALERLAREHVGTLAVARTLGQHSLPGTFGLRAAQWLAGVVAAERQVADVLRQLPLQWGGAAGTMAALTQFAGDHALVLTDALAARLGLALPVAPWQTTRWPMTRIAGSAAEAVAACTRIANDVAFLTRPEVAEVAEPQVEGRGGSSAMPQKQNPVLSVLVRSASFQAPGALAQVVAAAAAAVDERPDGAWHAEWAPLRQLLRLAGGAASLTRELAEGLVVFPERMRANLDAAGPLILTERITAVVVPLLAEAGIPDGAAQIAAAIADTRAGTASLPDLLRAALPRSVVSDALLADLLDPVAYPGQARQLILRIIADRGDSLS